MSLFSSQTSWPAGCSSASQSPINLSQSSAKPCQLSCDLVMDEGMASSGNVVVSDEGLLLLPTSGSLGSCKFRGETYVCQGFQVNHPSHHTIEGVQADGEIVAYFGKPTGERLSVSSLFRVSTSQTSSYTFFKQFVPYGLTTGDTQVTLQNWGVSMMVPSSSAYFTYQGSTLVPPCVPSEWVVYRTMINMDTTDFAYLVRNLQAGSRSIQALGDREVFFNDIENAGPMPNDNKFYLKLRPTGSHKKKKPEPKSVDLKGNQKDEPEDPNKPTTLMGHASKTVSDNGGWWGLLLFFSLCVAVIIGRYGSTSTPFTAEFIKKWAVWFRGFFVRPSVP